MWIEFPLTLAFWCDVFLVTTCTGDEQNIQRDHLAHCREGEENYFADGENSSCVSYEVDSDLLSNSGNCGGSINSEWFLPNTIITVNCERLCRDYDESVAWKRYSVCVYTYK